MEKNELINEMKTSVLTAIQENAASEIAAFQQMKTKLAELQALRSKHNEQVEKLRKEIAEPRPAGLSVDKIEKFLDKKKKLRNELQASEEAAREIGDGFLPEVKKEVDLAGAQLLSAVDPTVRRIAKAWQDRIDELTREIDMITECWEDVFYGIRGHVDLQGMPAFASGGNLVEINMALLLTPQQRQWRKINEQKKYRTSGEKRQAVRPRRLLKPSSLLAF